MLQERIHRCISMSKMQLTVHIAEIHRMKFLICLSAFIYLHLVLCCDFIKGPTIS